MKHVFVETNFLVSLLRPLPDPSAERLFARNDGVDLRLYLPWCSQAEASRTMPDIIKADLGFTDNMMEFTLQRWLPDRSVFDKREIDKLKKLAEAARHEAVPSMNQRIEACAAHMTRIEP